METAVKLRWVGLLVLLAMVAYGALWFELSHRLESGLGETLDALAARGFEVEMGEMQRSGFPHQVSIVTGGLDLRAARAEPALRARASDLKLTIHPWRFDRLLGQAQQIGLERGGLRFIAPRADITAERAGDGRRITLALDAGSLLDASEDAPLLRMTDVQAALLLAEEDGSEETGLLEPARARISMQSRGLRFVRAEGDGGLDELRLNAVLHGRIAMPWGRHALEQWRDEGGTLDIEELRLVWDDAALAAQGSLSLDEALRPLGALTVTLDNPARLLDRLRSAGWIDPRLAAQLRPLLASLPRSDAGAGDLSLPVSLQNGQVFLAGLPIARF